MTARSSDLCEESSNQDAVDLARYTTGGFDRGRPALVELAWLLAQAFFVSSWLPGSFQRRCLLRWFGAKLGKGVVIKPGVRVKFPWRLAVGAYSWIGEDVWIDNLGIVEIGRNCCLSQGAYLCTGSHDWSRQSFDLVVKPVALGDFAWVAAKACVAPGVRFGTGSVLGLGSVATTDLEPWTIYNGIPAVAVRERQITQAVSNKAR
jgi:putative colanic acid biosynthesis acetyltransferase WcaF